MYKFGTSHTKAPLVKTYANIGKSSYWNSPLQRSLRYL